MQQSLKFRLIGLAVILLSAAVVFPVFFDGAGYNERHIESVIPTAPERPEIVRIKPKNEPLPDTSKPAPAAPAVTLPKAPESVARVVAKKIADEKITLDVHKDQPVLDQQGVPVAWTLQLASFKDETNAKGLRKQLISAGHKVFTRKQGDLVKVYVGPEFQKSRLESLQQELKQDFGLNGIIVRFTTQ